MARQKEKSDSCTLDDWNRERTDTTSILNELAGNTGARPKKGRGQESVSDGYQKRTSTSADITLTSKSWARQFRLRKVADGHKNTTRTEIKHPSTQVSRIDKAIRHMSVRLYEVLDRVGASAHIRELRQDFAISWEVIASISNHTHQLSYSSYLFGSSSEGSTTPGMNSDTDILLCDDKYPVIDNISDAGDAHSLLMIRDKHTQPGYVKLQRVYNGRPQTIYTRDIYREKEYDREGRICVKHVSLQGMEGIDERNGPADTSIERNVDHVVGYRCSKIPEFSKWIGRNRQSKWTSKRMMDKMANMGCFVVGVGHPTSIERNIEWRLSFSLQEREMMFSMNIVQHKCYIVLKLIKKGLIEPIVGKSISSYHLKT